MVLVRNSRGTKSFLFAFIVFFLIPFPNSGFSSVLGGDLPGIARRIGRIGKVEPTPKEDVVTLASLKEKDRPYAMVVFENVESPDKPVGYVLKPEQTSFRGSTSPLYKFFPCVFLPYLFPGSFSRTFSKVEKYENLDELLKQEKLEVIESWPVEKFYAERAKQKFEFDRDAKYSYSDNKFDARSFDELQKLSDEELHKRTSFPWKLLYLGNYCNRGTFVGYTNNIVYTVGVLDRFAEISRLSSNFSSTDGASLTPFERLIEASRGVKFNPLHRDSTQK